MQILIRAVLMLCMLVSLPCMALEECSRDGASLAMCAAVNDRIQVGVAIPDTATSYYIGAYTGFVAGTAFADHNRLWCPKEPFRTSTLEAIVAKYLRENPEKWQEAPTKLVRTALALAFPCKGN